MASPSSDMANFILSIFSTVLGGLLLALIFFLLKERVLRIPKLSGNWIFEKTTLRTGYNPYRNMVLRYYVLLWQEGNQIKGTGEKIYEKANGQKKEYTGKHRTQIEISGYLTKNYLSKDEIVIHYIEKGEERDSSTMHNLFIKTPNQLEGRFISTIANQEGIVKWTRRAS
jgi:hypothetical protein